MPVRLALSICAPDKGLAVTTGSYSFLARALQQAYIPDGVAFQGQTRTSFGNSKN